MSVLSIVKYRPTLVDRLIYAVIHWDIASPVMAMLALAYRMDKTNFIFTRRTRVRLGG